ncbi:MAG TPA: hypothetical protein VET48_06180 [Steroidobacteraceae bacterium]|nr:hypothetical protein [Steroidobacteraceae bacterium]
MRKTLLLILAIVLSANGFFMLGWPEVWYHTLPTVPHTGPFNAHFVRDIGCAYLVSAASLAYLAFAPERGRSAALTGSAFLVMHGLVHIWDTVAGRASVEHLMTDFIGVLAIPALALYLSWSRVIAAR